MRALHPQPYQGVDHFERILDPMHADAFAGTPAEGVVKSTGPRREVWAAIDWCGNVIGILSEEPPDPDACPQLVDGTWFWVSDERRQTTWKP